MIDAGMTMAASEGLLLSIIIPAHNEEKYLPECVESVVVSTAGVPYEILIVDDGSSDNTKSVAEDLANTFSSVRVLFHPDGINRGVAASRNLAIRSARGKYISFIDADDIMLPHRYEKTLKLLAETDVDGVLDAVGLVFDEGDDLVRWGNAKELYKSDTGIAPNDFLRATLTGQCSFHTASLTVRRALFDKTGFYKEELKLSEDYHLWLRMAACGKFRVGENDLPVVFYRRHAGNTWVPHHHDSFRDLEVVGDVMAWAKRSPWVSPYKIGVLDAAFTNKLFHCLQLAQTERHISKGLKAALAAARCIPRLLLGKRYWANLFRLFFPKRAVV